jgi:hypothetical protein
MSDPEKTKKRRFWQLHLSTAVLVMLTAGVLLGALICYARAPVVLSEKFYQATPDRIRLVVYKTNLQRMDNILLLTLLGILALLAIAGISERLIRRREDRKA